MKRHFLALGIIVALTCYSIFYLSFNAHVLSIQKMSLVVRAALPFIVGGYALAIGPRYPWLPANEMARRKLLMTLFPQLALPLAAVAMLATQHVDLFFQGLALSLLTSISTVLFWQGFIWPKMNKSKGRYRAAVRLSMLQLLFSVAIAFIAMVPIVGFHSLWGMVSFLATLKLFQATVIAAQAVALLAVTLLVAGLVNLALARMMEWTDSILYPALTYSVTTFLLMWAARWRGLLANQGVGFLIVFIALAAVGSSIYLYRGAKKLGDRAKSL